MAEQPFFLHQSIHDFDEFCANARHWDMEYRQLEAGRFSSELMIFGGLSSQFSRARLHRGMIQQGTSPKELITIGLLAKPEISIHWRNIDIRGDMLLIFPPGGELQSISQSDFDVFTLSFSEKKLNQLCAAHELPEFNALIKKNEAFRCHPGKLAALRRYLLSMDHALTTGKELIRSPHYLTQLEEEIAANVVSLIAESLHPVIRKPIRKRDKAVKLAENYIFESDSDVVTIPELCVAAHASQRTLEYAFRERYGCTIKAYTLMHRLNNAHKQLRHAEPGESRVSDIAQRW